MKNIEIITVFCESYSKKYMIDYTRSYKIDNKSVTRFKKLVEDLTDDEVTRLVEIVVENYEHWTTSMTKYPLKIRLLTIDWIINKARDVLQAEKANESHIEKTIVEESKRTETSLSSILKRFGGK